MIKLQLMYKETVLKELLTDKTEISVGRNFSNDLCIDNLAASSRHARIFKGPDQYAIEDLNSTNGTFINGKETKTQLLNENDKIQIGKHTIVVTYQEGDSFEEKSPNRITQSTYMLDPKEREKLIK
ncbi:MAG: FHA domain-containing protein [Desulfosarcina sp.]|nr:FHA domain-containing protein [Desulfosarcina sp.]MBC2742304.1 FHA domain-containing protein [Desulfosarcina sp.]MBC2765215.1 FHA domain-containing protein [Desulfosarcina sp.]